MSLESPLAATFGGRIAAYLNAPEDFRKHRKRMNKRLLKIRHELGIVTSNTANYSAEEKTSAISDELYAANALNGVLLLLLAERDVVHALEVKIQLEVSPKRVSSQKRLMASKLKKAVSTCIKLLAVTKAEPCALKQVELHVYAALVHGMYALNKKRWGDALYTFSLARCGLELLSGQTDDTSASSERSLPGLAIAELLDTFVDPSLNLAISQHAAVDHVAADVRTIARKHCRDGTVAYLGPGLDYILAVDASCAQEIDDEHVPRSVLWRQHEATLHNVELAVKLARVSRLDWRTLNEPEQFDALYSQWAALVDVHTADLAKNKDEDDMLRVQDGAILLTYLRYNMLFVRVRRDLLLVEKLTQGKTTSAHKTLRTCKDVLRLYSSIKLTVAEVKDLPGVYNDEDLNESLENLSLFFAVKRSLVAASAYSAAVQPKKALAILLHLQRTFFVSDKFYAVGEFPYDVTSHAQAKQLEAQIAQKTARVDALTQVVQSTQNPGRTYLCENVHKFDLALDSIARVASVDRPGQIGPVLSKPVLFDIAFNYIGYAVDERVEPAAETAAEPAKLDEEKKKSSFFGLFGR
ncbi:hypothetical protein METBISCDRAFT_12851 [Metschnikowia bicuspidata]|uniref:Signal recognition particle subunit SRP68 n=1 Tax=Metschnikowia bicuspidata TaxID=27322 RepID=A0A4P9ZGP8_9ASCO|nr:hypothetical protein METBISCDRAFT_12851 [Metschnikowia bicuspidata]